MIDKLFWWLAWKMPKRIAYLCTVRVGAHATQVHSQRTPSEINLIDILSSWTPKRR